MSQPPNDGEHHHSNPDGGTERPQGNRRPTTRSPNSPGIGHRWVIALAGLLVGGMVGIYGSGLDPTDALANRDRHQP
jgi:hypothetical protein